MQSQSVKGDVMNSAANLYQQMNAAATPNNIYSLPERTKAEGTPFPVQLGTADPDDVRMSMRRDVVDDQGKVAGYGVATADERVFDYLERKKEAQIEADYRSWVVAQADFTTPAQAAYWNQVAPWITDLKLQEIDRSAEIQKRMAQLQVRGPQSDDDFRFMFMIQKGIIRTPTKPLHLLNEDKELVRSTNDYQRGMFNPLVGTPPRQGWSTGTTGRPDTWDAPFTSGGGATGFNNKFGGGVTNAGPGRSTLNALASQ